MNLRQTSELAKLTPQQLKEYGDRLPDSAWELEKDDGLRRVYIHWVDRENGVCIRKVENLPEDALIRDNADSLFESKSKRFGDGVVNARIPLNVFYREMAPRLKEGDEDFVKWFLNHPDKQMYRRFRGKV